MCKYSFYKHLNIINRDFVLLTQVQQLVWRWASLVSSPLHQTPDDMQTLLIKNMINDTTVHPVIDIKNGSNYENMFKGKQI